MLIPSSAAEALRAVLRALLSAALAALAACASPDGKSPPGEVLRGGLTASPPASWGREAPSSSARVAQFRIAGDAGPASLVVYHFGAGGGSVVENFERWRGQFEAPEGSALEEMEEHHDVAGLAVHELAVGGTYVAEVTPGAAERHHEPGWGMRAAVVETPGGSYYLKLVGPAATVRAAESDWRAFVASLRFTQPSAEEPSPSHGG